MRASAGIPVGRRRADGGRTCRALAAEPAVPWPGLRTVWEHGRKRGARVACGRGTAHKQLVVEKAGVTFTPRRMPSSTAS